jgi:CheY-like chemotaxis protein
MLGKKDPPSNPLKEIVARHLRAADTYVKEGQFDNAMIEIQRALNLDPKNYYARSFQERIRSQMEKTQQQATAREQQEANAADQRLEEVSQLLRNAEQYIAAKDYKSALAEIAKVYKIDPHNYFATSYSDRIDTLMSQEAEKVVPVEAPPSVQSPPPVQKPKPIPVSPPISVAPPTPSVPLPQPEGKAEKASIVMYRELLKEMWYDGKLTSQEIEELAKVRQMFNISQQEHEEAEKQVHTDAYVDALKIAWRDGVISQTESAVLELMREKFSISMEEHLSAEAKILWARNNNALTKETLLIADDDRTLLLSLAAKMKKHGYEVLTAERVPKALKLLEQTTPDLILSDLMYGEGEMTGLEFYQEVRNNPKLKQVPFLLMSGISDEYVVRAGMRMGVDDFLAKPFSLELLLATIEGKLRS